MKRRWISMTLLAASLALAGCGKKEEDNKPTETVTETVTEAASTEDEISTESLSTEETEIDYEKIYEGVLHHTYDILAASDVFMDDATDEDKGIYEKKKSFPGEEALKKIGYVLRDISGDGVPELIIAQNANGIILAIYTVDNDKPFFVCAGINKNSLNLCKGGSNQLYNYATNNAPYTKFGTMHLSEDGKNVVWDECYYSDGSARPNYYYNTTGEMDTQNSEKLQITAQEFESYKKPEEQLKYDLGLTLFLYMPGGSVEPPSTTADGLEIVDATGSGIEVRLADYNSGELDNCSFMDISTGEEHCELGVFAVGGDVVEIVFYKVKHQTSEDGEDVLYSDGSFARVPYIKEKEPLALWIDMPNDERTTGVSFVDASGQTTYYAISLSPSDGSVVLTPFTLSY